MTTSASTYRRCPVAAKPSRTWPHATDLFTHGGCMNHTGYTQHMLALICRPRMVMLTGGRPKTLGDINGPSNETVATCLGRMVNWWKLVEAVLETEFPGWDLLLQVTAFQCPKRLGHQPHHPRTIADALQCIRLGFGQPVKRVRSLAPDCEQVREASAQRFGLFCSLLAERFRTCGGRCPTRETRPIVEPAASFVALRGLRRLIQRSGTDV